MTLTKQLQALGSWQVQLQDNVPGSVLNDLLIDTDAFGLLIVTPAWVDPTAYSNTDLLGLSCYTGLYRRAQGAPRMTTLVGVHCTALLSDENSRGPFPVISTTATDTLPQWVTQIVAGSALTAGTVAPLGGLTYEATQSPILPTHASKDLLQLIVSFFISQAGPLLWRVNDNLTVDVFQPDGTFTAVFTSDWFGPDQCTLDASNGGGIPGSPAPALRATFTTEEDVENYVTDIVWGLGFDVVGTTPFTDPVGNPLVWREVIDAPGVTDTDLENLTTATLGLLNQVAYQPSITTDTKAVTVRVNPGDSVFCWEPLGNLTQVSGPSFYPEVIYRGESIFPDALDVQGVTMPVEQGMGVYFQRHDQSIVDLTRWVKFEPPGAQITVGTSPQTLTQVMQPIGAVQ